MKEIVEKIESVERLNLRVPMSKHQRHIQELYDLLDWIKGRVDGGGSD